MEQQAANILLGQAGPSDRFKIKYGILTFRLKIKPLTARQIVQISGEASKIDIPKAENDLFVAMMENSQTLSYISNIIAISTGARFKRIVAGAVMDLPLQDIFTLFKIVRKQSDPEVFFYILASTKGLTKMIAKPKAE